MTPCKLFFPFRAAGIDGIRGHTLAAPCTMNSFGHSMFLKANLLNYFRHTSKRGPLVPMLQLCNFLFYEERIKKKGKSDNTTLESKAHIWNNTQSKVNCVCMDISFLNKELQRN